MSSISQIERSSSQTRMLPMRPPVRHDCGTHGWIGGWADRLETARLAADRVRLDGIEAPQAQHENAALSLLGARPDLAFVRLHNLINDGQAEAGAAFKSGLKRLENLFDLLPGHPGAGVGKVDLPIFAIVFN